MNTDTPAQRVAGIIRAGLAERDISIRAAANQTGIPATTLHRRLAGHQPLTISDLAALSPLIEMTVYEIAAKAETTEKAA